MIIIIATLAAPSITNASSEAPSNRSGFLTQTTSALGINAAGWVVGAADTGTGSDAFVYMNGVMYDLNSLLANAPGIDLTEAVAINGNGQILANGPNGDYLLTPAIPEPSSLWLAFTGLLPILALVSNKRRKKRYIRSRSLSKHSTATDFAVIDDCTGLALPAGQLSAGTSCSNLTLPNARPQGMS